MFRLVAHWANSEHACTVDLLSFEVRGVAISDVHILFARYLQADGHSSRHRAGACELPETRRGFLVLAECEQKQLARLSLLLAAFQPWAFRTSIFHASAKRWEAACLQPGRMREADM